jgi:hypothetical protein
MQNILTKTVAQVSVPIAVIPVRCAALHVVVVKVVVATVPPAAPVYTSREAAVTAVAAATPVVVVVARPQAAKSIASYVPMVVMVVAVRDAPSITAAATVVHCGGGLQAINVGAAVALEAVVDLLGLAGLLACELEGVGGVVERGGGVVAPHPRLLLVQAAQFGRL